MAVVGIINYHGLEQRVEKFHSLPYSSNYTAFYIAVFFMRRDFAGDVKKFSIMLLEYP